MMSQISGPCCDSDIEPDQCKSFVWESHVRQQIFVIWEDFFREKKQNPAWFSMIYILKIINVCQVNIKHGKKLYRRVILFLMQWQYCG